jgi:hypothetical protein
MIGISKVHKILVTRAVARCGPETKNQNEKVKKVKKTLENNEK